VVHKTRKFHDYQAKDSPMGQISLQNSGLLFFLNPKIWPDQRKIWHSMGTIVKFNDNLCNVSAGLRGKKPNNNTSVIAIPMFLAVQ